MVVWKPSLIGTELVVMRVMLLTFTASKVEVVPGGTGLPATYRVVPFNRPTLAPPTGTEAMMAIDGRLSCVTEAGAPEPHSGPQFSTYAVLLSLLKKALTGRANPGISIGITVVAFRFTRKTESELSAKISRYWPLGLSAM